MTIQRLDEKETVWNSQPVYQFTGSLADLTDALPMFRRTRFAHEGALNEYLDLILREPHGDDDRLVPVATVSRRYALVQHRDIVDWVRAAFEQQKWDPAMVTASARFSEYGERMFVRIELPGATEEVRVGDKLAAEVRIWNSVDRSRALEVAIGWLRLVCLNGLKVWSGDRLRKIHHIDWMSRESPVDFLRERLPKSREQVDRLRRWASCPIAETKLVEWVDGPVTEAWGKGRAARVLHISRTGRDCSVGRFVAGRRASELEVSLGRAVPGAPSKTVNVYDLYQTLLWMAGHERAMEEREAKTEQALDLIRPLLSPNLRQHAY